MTGNTQKVCPVLTSCKPNNSSAVIDDMHAIRSVHRGHMRLTSLIIGWLSRLPWELFRGVRVVMVYTVTCCVHKLYSVIRNIHDSNCSLHKRAACKLHTFLMLLASELSKLFASISTVFIFTSLRWAYFGLLWLLILDNNHSRLRIIHVITLPSTAATMLCTRWSVKWPTL